jgi:hypothetical protein
MKFWMEEHAELVRNFDFVPTSKMSDNAKLNALTRLVIIIAIVLYFADKKQYAIGVLVIGILVVLMVYNLFVRKVEGYRDVNIVSTKDGYPAEQVNASMSRWLDDVNTGNIPDLKLTGNQTPLYDTIETDGYMKRVPMGQYLQASAQIHPSILNNQRNEEQRLHMDHIQRNYERHTTYLNGLPEMGFNVDYNDARLL